jgi:hypothetical protein
MEKLVAVLIITLVLVPWLLARIFHEGFEEQGEAG